MSDKDLKYITDSLLNAYANSSLINEEYISNLLKALKENNVLNDVAQTIFTCKEHINNFLAEKAKSDEKILFELAIDMAPIKVRVCLKLKLDAKRPIYDEYLMEGILSYDGSKDLELFLSSYLMKKIRMKYVPEKTDKKLVYKDSSKSEATKMVEAIPIVIEKEQEQLHKEEISEEVTEESILVEQTNSKLNGTSKNTSEIKKLTKKQLKQQKRKKTKTKASKQEEYSFDTSIEDLEEILEVSKEDKEELENITKDLCDPLDFGKKVREITLEQKGSGKENILIKLYKLLEVNCDEDNLLYTYYKKLRFGAYETYYTLQEIAEILNISLNEVIEYEEYTANIIKETLSKNLEQNISLILK